MTKKRDLLTYKPGTIINRSQAFHCSALISESTTRILESSILITNDILYTK